jgi:hypothetical protein
VGVRLKREVSQPPAPDHPHLPSPTDHPHPPITIIHAHPHIPLPTDHSRTPTLGTSHVNESGPWLQRFVTEDFGNEWEFRSRKGFYPAVGSPRLWAIVTKTWISLLLPISYTFPEFLATTSCKSLTWDYGIVLLR